MDNYSLITLDMIRLKLLPLPCPKRVIKVTFLPVWDLKLNMIHPKLKN
jgi:hypothetical protein